MYHFVHTFSTGTILTLSVDTSVSPPRMSHPNVMPSQLEEYNRWLHEVVVPGILAISNQVEVEAEAIRG